MKRLLLLSSIIFINYLLQAQNDNYKMVFDSFQTYYNNSEYDQIFNRFSLDMQQFLPLENTQSFLKSVKSEFGNIEDKQFIDYEQNYARYRTTFEKAMMQIDLSLDDKNKINGLSIKPYEEQLEIANALMSYPKSISAVVFDKSKGFPNNTQLSIAVIENGRTNYYGIIKQNDTIKEIENQDKVFEIGSITKVLTATVLASLVVEKEISLTDVINNYYTFEFKDSIQLRFESLANHTSGLPRMPENIELTNILDPYKHYGAKELKDYLKDHVNFGSKPETYVYSNLGAALLSYTLELSQKTDFRQLLQERVFDKYNMYNSFTTRENLKNKLVKGLDRNGNITSNWNFDIFLGAGGVLSTTSDLAKFAIAHSDHKDAALALTRKPTFQVSNNMQIGLFWHILKSKNGTALFWHNGGTNGYSSSIIINTTKQSAIIILSNVSGFHTKTENIDEIGFLLMKHISEK